MTAENLRFAKAVSGGWVIGCVLREKNILKVAAELGYDKSPQITYEDFEKGEYGWCEISEPKKYNWSHRTLKRKQIFGTKIKKLNLEHLNEALFNFPLIPDRLKEDD